MQLCSLHNFFKQDSIVKSKNRRTTHTKAFDPDLLTSNGIAVLLRQIQMIFIMDINDTHTAGQKKELLTQD